MHMRHICIYVDIYMNDNIYVCMLYIHLSVHTYTLTVCTHTHSHIYTYTHGSLSHWQTPRESPLRFVHFSTNGWFFYEWTPFFPHIALSSTLPRRELLGSTVTLRTVTARHPKRGKRMPGGTGNRLRKMKKWVVLQVNMTESCQPTKETWSTQGRSINKERMNYAGSRINFSTTFPNSEIRKWVQWRDFEICFTWYPTNIQVSCGVDSCNPPPLD